jgi:hypothetical protein
MSILFLLLPHFRFDFLIKFFFGKTFCQHFFSIMATGNEVIHPFATGRTGQTQFSIFLVPRTLKH